MDFAEITQAEYAALASRKSAFYVGMGCKSVRIGNVWTLLVPCFGRFFTARESRDAYRAVPDFRATIYAEGGAA